MFTWRQPENIKHVLVFFQQGPFIQRIQPLIHAVDLSVEFWTDPPLEPIPAEVYAKIWVDKGAVVVRIDTERNIWNITNSLPSCVSVVKVMTGFNSYAITPYGLYKDLLRRGGQQIFGG